MLGKQLENQYERLGEIKEFTYFAIKLLNIDEIKLNSSILEIEMMGEEIKILLTKIKDEGKTVNLNDLSPVRQDYLTSLEYAVSCDKIRGYLKRIGDVPRMLKYGRFKPRYSEGWLN